MLEQPLLLLFLFFVAAILRPMWKITFQFMWWFLFELQKKFVAQIYI